MVIQRWQSVFLLIAAIAMGVYAFVPCAIVDGVQFAATDFPSYMALNLAIAALLFANIFLFKNLKFQTTVATINSILILGSLGCLAILVFCREITDYASFDWSIVLPILAFVFTLMARRRIIADRRLLSSADRLR